MENTLKNIEKEMNKEENKNDEKLENKSENKINSKDVMKEEDVKNKKEEQNVKNSNKNQILQDKLKKIFTEREVNKYKYNIVNIPDNLKYSSDNSNSSSPKKSDKKNKLNTKKDVNKLENNNNNDNLTQNKKNEDIVKQDLYKNNLKDLNVANDNINKDIISGEKEKNSNEDNANDKNDLYKNNNLDNNNDNKGNNIKIENNNNTEGKTGINPTEETKNNICNNNSIKDNTDEKDKNNDNSNINNKDNMNSFDKEINDAIEHNQACKNYVIKRIPERKKNKKINNNEEMRNRTYSVGFGNNGKQKILNNRNNDINNNENKNKEKEDINSNLNSKEESEEEKNRNSYRQLMARKLKDNINQPSNEQENKNKNNIINLEKSLKKEENKNDNDNDNDIKNREDRSRTLRVGMSKEKTAKEGALKILELIKAKKNEKSAIDQKKKETQEIIKKAKSQPVDYTESTSTLITKEEEILDSKNLFNQSTNRTQKNDIKNNKDDINQFDQKKEDKNEKEENARKENNKKIYKRFKGKSSLMSSANKNVKKDNENENNTNNINNNNNNNNNNENKINNHFSSNKKSNSKNVAFNVEKIKSLDTDEKKDSNNKEFINNEFKVEKHKRMNSNNLNIKNCTNTNNNGYKTEIDDLEELKKNEINSKIFRNKSIKEKAEKTENNIALNFEEKLRRRKLEKDLAAEINKDELSTGRDTHLGRSKYIINRNKTVMNINSHNNKPYMRSSCKKKIINNNMKLPHKKDNNNNNNANDIGQPKLENNTDNTNNNLKELSLLNQNDKVFQTKNANNSNTVNFYGNPNHKKYEQIKTYQNQKNIINMNMNVNINTQSPNKLNNIYAPKKRYLFNKGKPKMNQNAQSPYISLQNSPEFNLTNKNNENVRSPKPFNMINDNLTYVKKSLPNASKKKDNFQLNNSLGNLHSPIDNNFNIHNIIKNKGNNGINEINAIEVKNNLNSSFQQKMNLERSQFNPGNIFNRNIEDEDNNRINLNSSYGGRFFRDNIPSIQKIGHVEGGFNTFYINNNKFRSSNNINANSFCKSKKGNLYTKYDSDYIYSTINSNNNNNNNSNKVTNIYNYSYKANNKNLHQNNYDIKNNYMTNITKNNFQINLYDLKYEDLLILEDKLINIITLLDDDKSIYNECFDYWNFFFNCSLYENINKIIQNCDDENKNLMKISINSNLMSIILSYDTAFDSEKLDKIRPLLLEMLELCHKLLINTYEFILNLIKNNNSNIWIKKLYHLINSSKLSDGSESLFIDSNNITEKEKMKYNINFLKQKIYYILHNYPSDASENYLMSLFKKLNDKTYEDINDFFLEYILREKDIKYSILASTFLKSGETISPKPYPYLKYTSPKNYTLILDIDETLFHFKINEDDDEQGVLKIRPGVFQFIDEIKEYYEIILFSEAEESYIELITEAIGENRYLYDYILCRDYVTIVGQNFVKELSKIGRPLDKIIIIDNMPQNFSYNKENSIYIKSFWGEENDDKALIDLIPILINIARSGKDVRKELVKYKEKIVTKISSNIYKHYM